MSMRCFLRLPLIPSVLLLYGIAAASDYECGEWAAGSLISKELWETWSLAKRRFCCGTKRHACLAERRLDDSYNCQVDLAFWQMSWGSAKKEYCCKSYRLGCEAAAGPVSTEPAPYDCPYAPLSWEREWQKERKEWCCEYRGVACPHEEEPAATGGHPDAYAFRCGDDVRNWEVGWSETKKSWCCKYKGIGCQRRQTANYREAKYDCKDDARGFYTRWSEEKKKYCCSNGLDCNAALGGAGAAHGGDDAAAGRSQHPGRQAPPAPAPEAPPAPAPEASPAPAPEAPAGKVKWHSFGQGKACRPGSEDHAHADGAGDPPRLFPFVMSVGDCKERCERTRGCVGVGYQSASQRCEVWTQPIHHTVDMYGFECLGIVGGGATGGGPGGGAPSTTGGPKSHAEPLTGMEHRHCWTTIKTYSTWTANKKEWCCGHQLSCPGYKFSCEGDTPTWPPRKREYCCLLGGRGCPKDEGPAGGGHDCREGPGAHWLREKREWCCARHRLGCPEGDFDCSADEHPDRWSSKQQEYCCMTKGRGCPTTTTTPAPSPASTPAPSSSATASIAPLPKPELPVWLPKPVQSATDDAYDCMHGHLNWKSLWSAEKTDWCCTYRFSCPGFEFDCENQAPPGGWLPEKREYCCVIHGRACPTTTTTTLRTFKSTTLTRTTTSFTTPAGKLFDCHLGASHPEQWSLLKKEWCCVNQRVACQLVGSLPAAHSAADSEAPGAAPSATDSAAAQHQAYNCSRPYDCRMGRVGGDESGWSTKKRAWCCWHEHAGCTGRLKGYDCMEDLWTWSESWSPAKRDWCCLTQLRWCPKDDRDGGSDWSPAQRQWCCDQERVGCTGTISMQQVAGGVREHAPVASRAPQFAAWACLLATFLLAFLCLRVTQNAAFLQECLSPTGERRLMVMDCNSDDTPAGI